MSSRSLEMPQRAKRAQRSRLPWILTVLAIIALAIGWAVWYVRTPGGLSTSDRTVEDSGVVGQTLYIKMYGVGDDFDRTLRLTDVSIDVSPSDGVEAKAMVCVDGSISVTTDPTGQCKKLEDAEDAEFSDNDSIVLAVTASQAGTVEIGQLDVSFRDGIKWGSDRAGIAGAELTFAESTPGTVDDSSSTDGDTGERPGQDDKPGKTDKHKPKDRKKDSGPNA
ncbi:hypothetical protein [Nocardioides sp. MH1]|uniref:hypothetical protein n=1 Tax=Nocardioides sp. MH1 TaxID=3242490 RepID=UPI00352011BD